MKKKQRYERWRFLVSFFCCTVVLLGVLSGCGMQENKKSTQKIHNATVNENIIQEIKDRGYLIVGCKEDVPGLSIYEKDTKTWSGIEVELAYKTAANVFEVTYEEAKEKELVHFKGVTVANREDALRSGEVDCIFATYTITEQRKQEFVLSDSYYKDYIGMMVRKTGKDSNSLGNGDITSIADLDGKYVGIPQKSTTREAFLSQISTMLEAEVNPIFCEFADYQTLFKALKDKKIDVMAVDTCILKGYLDSSVQILDVRFSGQEYGAAVMPENQKLMDYINEAVND